MNKNNIFYEDIELLDECDIVNIRDNQDNREVQEVHEIIYYGLEEQSRQQDDVIIPITIKPLKSPKINKNFILFGLDEKQSEMVCGLMCGGLFVIILNIILIVYMIHYFSL
jgi:hypothetical protein